MPRTERRHAPRGKTSILTAYRCLENGNATSTGFGRTLNLSHFGALLESPDALALGQTVELEFLLDEDNLVTVTGRVSRITKAKAFCHAAVEFAGLDTKSRRLIDLQIGLEPPAKPAGKAKPPSAAKPKAKTSARRK